ncbi:hypothetical protein JHK86_012913 [Glycine max]|nr:hypothetical protein JHK86_012913 [Glycine max]
MGYLKNKVYPAFVRERRATKRDYEEFKVRINSLVATTQKVPEDGWTMQDGTPWSGNNVRDHPSMIQNSWQDGVLGTNCPIPPNSNYTYKFQAKDQIGTYTYFPSTQLHKAAGGFRALNVYHRSVIPIPYPNPDGDFTLLVGDWYKTNHKNLYDSLDVHVGQSVAVLVTLNQPPKDYYIIASTRFTEKPLTTTVVLHYANSISSVFGPVPAPPVDKYDFDWSMKQARTYRWNLTANAARPNPQGHSIMGRFLLNSAGVRRVTRLGAGPKIESKPGCKT